MSGKIDCSILTPERTLFESQVDSIVVQAYDGEMGFLHNHTPLIAELGIGEIRLNEGGAMKYMVIEGGIVEIKNNKLVILAENALLKEDLTDLDKTAVQNRIKELAAEKMSIKKSSEEKLEIMLEHAKLKARLKVALR